MRRRLKMAAWRSRPGAIGKGSLANSGCRWKSRASSSSRCRPSRATSSSSTASYPTLRSRTCLTSRAGSCTSPTTWQVTGTSGLVISLTSMPPFLLMSTAIGRKPTSSVSSPRRLKLGAVLGGLVGLVLAVWLLKSYGVLQIFAALVRVGWLGMVALILFHLPQMAFSALGWEVISGGQGPRPRLAAYVLLRWIREGVNNLLPLAQIGGEFAAARLLQRRGVQLASAIGSTIADLMLEMATQVLFTVLGVVLLVQLVGHTQVSELVTRGLLIAALGVA